MLFQAVASLALDFGEAASPDLLENLSGVAAVGDTLWTVSDEGRTIECFVPSGDGYDLRDQISLDKVIAQLPGGADDELDLESIDVADGTLWVCGSHCRVRKKPEADGRINPKLRDRPSRNVLAALKMDAAGHIAGGAAIPFEGTGSLRQVLDNDPYLKPFLALPSKENGLDIEGLAAHSNGVLLGLRGPLIDSIAVVIRLALGGVAIRSYELSFLNLGGLGIRDLSRVPGGFLVLAGPVSDVPGPFRLYLWDGRSDQNIQTPREIWTWPESLEKPEGICVVDRAGVKMLLVVDDRPSPERLQGSRYRADLVSMPALG